MRNERLLPARIGTLQIAVALLQPLLADQLHERILVALLDEDDHLLDVVHQAAESEHEVQVAIDRLLNAALSLGTKAIVLAHNHPSGDPMPSDADRRATRQLVDICRPLGIRVHDHLIVAGDRVTSLRELGMM